MIDHVEVTEVQISNTGQLELDKPKSLIFFSTLVFLSRCNLTKKEKLSYFENKQERILLKELPSLDMTNRS